jgi:DNA-directed RNA polymerase subunit RPC12/RpoP
MGVVFIIFGGWILFAWLQVFIPYIRVMKLSVTYYCSQCKSIISLPSTPISHIINAIRGKKSNEVEYIRCRKCGSLIKYDLPRAKNVRILAIVTLAWAIGLVIYIIFWGFEV